MTIAIDIFWNNDTPAEMLKAANKCHYLAGRKRAFGKWIFHFRDGSALWVKTGIRDCRAGIYEPVARIEDYRK